MARNTKRLQCILGVGILLCLIAVIFLLLPKKRADVPTRELTPEQYSLSAIGKYLDVSSFVSADMLEGHLPQFTTFSFLFHSAYSNPYVPQYADAYVYRYTNTDYIVTAENYANLYIQSIPGKKNAALTLPDLPDHGNVLATVTDPNDLRRAESTGIYRLGELTYYYTDFYLTESALQYIQWQTKAFSFTLELNGFALDSFVPEDDPFLAKLLCGQTAEAAVAELNADISRTLTWRKLYMHWLPWALAGVLSITALVGLICLYKMKTLARSLERLVNGEAADADPSVVPEGRDRQALMDVFDTLCSKK